MQAVSHLTLYGVGFLEDGAKSTVLSLTGANCLPFGTYEDSIENLCLYAMWLNMSEDVLSDNSANRCV